MTEQSATASTSPRRQTGRSPSFPAINLETAIRRARELYERERQHPTSVDTIVRYWGYKAMSGPAAGALAALKKYGLMTDEGKGPERRGRLTHLAIDIIANPDHQARVGATKQAALKPGIHREMWDSYHNSPPSDENLRWELVRKRGFTESGADEFIRVYKQTVAFAQLDVDDHAVSSGAASPQDDGADAEPESPETEPRRDAVEPEPASPEPHRRHVVQPPAPGMTQYRIPVFGGRAVVVEGEFPLSEDDWNQFMAVLTAMKPALVERQQSVGQAGS